MLNMLKKKKPTEAIRFRLIGQKYYKRNIDQLRRSGQNRFQATIEKNRSGASKYIICVSGNPIGYFGDSERAEPWFSVNRKRVTSVWVVFEDERDGKDYIVLEYA